MRVDPVCLFYFYLIVYVCVCTCYHSAHVEVKELCGEGSFLLPLPGIEHRTSGLLGNCFYPLSHLGSPTLQFYRLLSVWHNDQLVETIFMVRYIIHGQSLVCNFC